MEPNQNPVEIYQLRVVLRETSPHIWRRFLVRSDSSIVDLHQTIQIGSVANFQMNTIRGYLKTQKVPGKVWFS
jgi:hypothetical protein